MSRVTADELNSWGVDHCNCRFCNREARIVEGEYLTADDFIYWQQYDRLILCTQCAETFLPRLLADVVHPDGNPDTVWQRLKSTFYRSMAKRYKGLWQRARRKPLTADVVNTSEVDDYDP